MRCSPRFLDDGRFRAHIPVKSTTDSCNSLDFSQRKREREGGREGGRDWLFFKIIGCVLGMHILKTCYLWFNHGLVL